MTLIVPFISPRFTVLVSDRRFILGDGRPIDDDGNKLVLFNRHHCFAYTGLAALDGYPTDMWLADVLASVGAAPLSTALTRVRERATARFRDLKFAPKWRRHAFIGTGWARLKAAQTLRPVIYMVSNYHATTGNALEEAQAEFDVRLTVLDPTKPFSWGIFGQPIIRVRAVRATRTFRRAGPVRMSENVVWRTLFHVMSETARENPAVGRGLLGLCIPLVSIRKSNSFTIVAHLGAAAQFDETRASFIDILARPDKFTVHGPTIVEDGRICHSPKMVRLDLDSSGRDVLAERYLKKAGANTYFEIPQSVVPPPPGS